MQISRTDLPALKIPTGEINNGRIDEQNCNCPPAPLPASAPPLFGSLFYRRSVRAKPTTLGFISFVIPSSRGPAQEMIPDECSSRGIFTKADTDLFVRGLGTMRRAWKHLGLHSLFYCHSALPLPPPFSASPRSPSRLYRVCRVSMRKVQDTTDGRGHFFFPRTSISLLTVKGCAKLSPEKQRRAHV